MERLFLFQSKCFCILEMLVEDRGASKSDFATESWRWPLNSYFFLTSYEGDTDYTASWTLEINWPRKTSAKRQDYGFVMRRKKVTELVIKGKDLICNVPQNWRNTTGITNNLVAILYLGCSVPLFFFILPSVIDLLYPCSLYHFQYLDLSLKIPQRLVIWDTSEFKCCLSSRSG